MKTKIPDGTKFQFGQHTFQFGQEVVELTDSAAIRNNPEALRSRFQEDGYLFIRGFHDAQNHSLPLSLRLMPSPTEVELKKEHQSNPGLSAEKTNLSVSFAKQRLPMLRKFWTWLIVMIHFASSKDFSIPKRS